MPPKLVLRSMQEIAAITEEIEAQTDRGAAIIGAAIVEDTLTEALKARLILTSRLSEKLFSYEKNGPLAHFSGKIDIASAVGFMPTEIYHSLHLVRRIRNRFAHSIGALTFADREVTQWTLAIKSGVQEIDHLSPVRRRYTGFCTTAAAGFMVLRELPNLRIVETKDHPVQPGDFMESFTVLVRHALNAMMPKS